MNLNGKIIEILLLFIFLNNLYDSFFSFGYIRDPIKNIINKNTKRLYYI